MSLLKRLRQALLPKNSPPLQPAPNRHAANMPDPIPPFQLTTAEMMRFDPQVRIGLGARNGLLLTARVQAESDDPQVARWVQQQWDCLWARHASLMLLAKVYGFLPVEVKLDLVRRGEFAGMVSASALRARPPIQTRLLVHGEELVGFSWKKPGANDQVRLAPQALLCTFGAEFDNHYGCSLLERAYPAWYEKYSDGGVKQTLRQRMVKDAYLGDVLWYPPDRKVETADGRTIRWEEIAREIVDNRTSGGALTLPLLYDQDGKRLVDYTPPHDTGSASAIFSWKRDNDLEIWKALEIPPEILEASQTGSCYSGRWIPFTVALTAVQGELTELVHCVDRDILRPLVKLNFGPFVDYEIRPQPLTNMLQQTLGSPLPGTPTA